MYAAQWFATLRRTRPALDAEIARGDFAGIFGWLRVNIWEQASRYETDELCKRASGSLLDPDHLHTHLTARYLGQPSSR
jgi:carboxypeptidase Taq